MFPSGCPHCEVYVFRGVARAGAPPLIPPKVENILAKPPIPANYWIR